jgi:hypothetical protein
MLLFRRTFHYTSLCFKNCWKCGTATAYKIKCAKTECGVLQPLSKGTTYYDVLLSLKGPAEPQSIEPIFDIDMSKVKRKFLEIQQSVHPDTFSLKSEVGIFKSMKE